jgi:hypothetical protein
LGTNLGIEVSSLACRIVEIERSPRWGSSGSPTPDTRVRSFAATPLTSLETTRTLASFRGRQAAVVVWNAFCEHRLTPVSDGPYEAMRAEAVSQFAESMSDVRVDRRRLLTDIAPAGSEVDGSGRRLVMLAVADAAAVRAVLRPIAAAGVRIRSVVTPALALLSLARTRRAMATPDAIDAYVALEETASCAVLVRNGLLVAARDIAWGYFENEAGRLRPGLDLAARLADELAALFGAAGAPVRQVCICGGLADLRSTTMPLMERLDVEVETLDSLFAIDAAHLPEPADEFRERASALRLAWAVAADRRAPINLLREAQRRSTNTRLARAAVMAGVAAGLGSAWSIERPWMLSPAETPIVRSMSRSMSLPLPARPLPAPPRPTPRPAVPVAQPEPAEMTERPVADHATNAIRGKPLLEKKPRVMRAAARLPSAAPAPFNAALGTILYAPNRQLAIIDGRIVQSGDEVKGARVVDITPTRVLLRDADGQPRQLLLSAASGK